MKNQFVVVVVFTGIMLGVLFWRFGGIGPAQQGAGPTICVGGECSVQLPGGQQVNGNAANWPPVLEEPYPDLELIDHRGEKVRLSSFKGSVLLIEPVGMTCPACQAFSGAHRYGAYKGVVPQQGLPSMEELFPRYTDGLSLSDDRITFVQLILYSMSMKAPTPRDAKKWAKHFRLDRIKNHVVLVGTQDLLGTASYNMIPGFQLVDRNSVFRSDSTGHRPRHSLWTHLLPMVPKLLQEEIVSQTSSEMTIEEAYLAIPHRRTVFDYDSANMSDEERAYLQKLFGLIDLAIVERVEMLMWLQSGGRRGAQAQDYNWILNKMNALEVPHGLNNVHQLALGAIKEQETTLKKWHTSGLPSNIARDSLVRSSSGKLKQAYGNLRNKYPREGKHNQAAFFDYLCALDFV